MEIVRKLKRVEVGMLSGGDTFIIESVDSNNREYCLVIDYSGSLLFEDEDFAECTKDKNTVIYVNLLDGTLDSLRNTVKVLQVELQAQEC